MCVEHILHVVAVGQQLWQQVGRVQRQHGASRGLAEGVEQGVVRYEVELFEVVGFYNKSPRPVVVLAAKRGVRLKVVASRAEGAEAEGVACARGVEVVTECRARVRRRQSAAEGGRVGGLPVVVIEFGVQRDGLVFAVDAFGRYVQPVAA